MERILFFLRILLMMKGRGRNMLMVKEGKEWAMLMVNVRGRIMVMGRDSVMVMGSKG